MTPNEQPPRSPLRAAAIVFSALLFSGVAPAAQRISRDASQTTYWYYIDSQTGKPYSSLYNSGPVRYVIQFPGHNPYDEFLYGGNFVAYLFIASKEPYEVRNLSLNLERDGRDLVPARNSFLSEQEWKSDTIMQQPKPARELVLVPPKRGLVGFIFRPDQLDGLAATALVISFDVIVGSRSTAIKKRFSLRRTERTEVLGENPRVREREPGEAVLVGPWWLEKQHMAKEYETCVAKAATDRECAIRVTGRGFLPRLRYDPIHFEGFFLHVDRYR